MSPCYTGNMDNYLNGVLILVLGAVLLVALTTPLQSQTLGYLGVYPDESMTVCEHAGGSSVSVAHVILTRSIPVQELTFTAPVPDCLGGSTAFVFESSPFPTTGNSQTGITIDLGGCVTEAPVTVLTIYYTGSTSSCCYWPLSPFAYEFVDCNGVTRPGASAVTHFWDDPFCCRTFDFLSAYDLYPPHDATGVPTNVVMTWNLPEPAGEEWVYISEQPYPPPPVWGGTTDYFTSYEPDFLEPNTTYYWMVGLQLGYDVSVRSPFQTFTTGDGPVATEETTWGRIKALYQ